MTWAPVLEWGKGLTARKIGQFWFHHLGHNETHGYGDKTREWQLDTVILMKRPQVPNPARLIEFELEFTKARERTPDNRNDFASVSIWLDETTNQWQSSPVDREPKRRPLDEDEIKALDYLCDTLADHGKPLATFNRPGYPANLRAVTIKQWQDYLNQRGMYDPYLSTSRSKFFRIKANLVTANRITVDRDILWLVP
jgi:hypothetical protein